MLEEINAQIAVNQAGNNVNVAYSKLEDQLRKLLVTNPVSKTIGYVYRDTISLVFMYDDGTYSHYENEYDEQFFCTPIGVELALNIGVLRDHDPLVVAYKEAKEAVRQVNNARALERGYIALQTRISDQLNGPDRDKFTEFLKKLLGEKSHGEPA